MKKHFLISVLLQDCCSIFKGSFCLLLIAFLISACGRNEVQQSINNSNSVPFTFCNTTSAIDNSALAEAVLLSAKYLESQVKENGQFVYRRMYSGDQKVRPGYNFLRHSGTIYAMAQAQRIKKDLNLLESMLSAGDYLKRSTIERLAGQPENILAVWSKSELTKSPQATSTKLGGAGLGLLALLSLEELKPGNTSLDTLRGLGEYIRFMQKTDGTYYSRYDPIEQSFDQDFTSLFYPGEAALALFTLYEFDPEEKWFESGLSFLLHMAKQRLAEPSNYNIIDHWSLLATQKLLSQFSDKLEQESYQLITDHALLNAKNIVFELSKIADRKSLDLSTGNVNSLGTQLEGLASVLPYLPLRPEDKEEYCKSIILGGKFLLDAQLKEGDTAGAFTKKPIWHPEFKQGLYNAEIRIDNIQHSMSAIYWVHQCFD